MVANDTTLLYVVAPLEGFGGVPVAVVFTGTLVAGPLGEAFTLGEVFTLGEAFALGEAFTLGEAFILGEAFTLGEASTLGVAFILNEVFTLGEAFTLGQAFTLGAAFTLGEVLSASPLHLFCSQHVASHFSKVIPGGSSEALQDFAWKSWHIDCVKIEIRKNK